MKIETGINSLNEVLNNDKNNFIFIIVSVGSGRSTLIRQIAIENAGISNHIAYLNCECDMVTFNNYLNDYISKNNIDNNKFGDCFHINDTTKYDLSIQSDKVLELITYAINYGYKQIYLDGFILTTRDFLSKIDNLIKNDDIKIFISLQSNLNYVNYSSVEDYPNTTAIYINNNDNNRNIKVSNNSHNVEFCFKFNSNSYKITEI